MTHPMDTTADLRSTHSPSQRPYDLIRQRLPQWLITAPPDIHAALRRAGAERADWFDRARQTHPEVIEALRQDCASHLYNEQMLKQILPGLPSLEAFAEPLLVAAIEERFGLKIDVRKACFFHASAVAVDEGFMALSRDSLSEMQRSLKNATRSLLQAALQNFEKGETVPGAMDLDEHCRAALYEAYPLAESGLAGDLLPILPEAFATLCRELDLGGRYQETIRAFFNPPSRPDEAPDAAHFNRRGLLKRVERSAFLIQVHLACLQGHISPVAYRTLLEVARNSALVSQKGEAVSWGLLRLWDIELTGVVVIGPSRDDARGVEKVVVYVPGDPVCPLKEYDSSAAFTAQLRDRMLRAGYLDFFNGLIPARHRDRVLAKLNDCLRPKVWNGSIGAYERRIDPQAKLHLRERTLSTGLLTAITDQKALVLKDDALFHAVPTAVEDEHAARRRLQYFGGLAVQALNIVGFAVPPVGAVMMAVTAAQLSAEVFEGVDSWTRGEWQQGWGYLMDVMENVALMAALGGAQQSAGVPAMERITVETPSFIEELHEVEWPSGQTRLWKPDITPFVHDVILPAGLEPDALGLYHYQDKTWVSVEDKLYAVRQSGPDGAYRLEHPTRTQCYEPDLQHNGAGAWLHAADRPLEWEGLKLFRRMGYSPADFSDATARRILLISDTRDAVLRRLLAEHQRPPALLEDTAQRLRLYQMLQCEDQMSVVDANVFESRYRAMSVSQEANAQPLIDRYPDLPSVVADELARHASPSDQEALIQGRVSVRLADETRAYQQQIRLARAYEGLYLNALVNPDTDILILHSLQRLPGWPSELRVEVREGWYRGGLVDAVGPDEADSIRVLVRQADGYEAFDGQGQELHGRADLYASVLHALPDASRRAIGFPGTWEGSGLRDALQSGQWLPRDTLRGLLKMRPARPVAKSPMRLAEGRVGYPLSGRGLMQGFITRDTLLDLIRISGVERAECPAEQILIVLEQAGLSRQQIHWRLTQVLEERSVLDAALNEWGDASASFPDGAERGDSRIAIHDALWRHWSEHALSELAYATPLTLQQVVLADFPDTLPDFFRRRVSHLELLDITVRRSVAALPQPISLALDDRLALERFFRQFPSVQSLEISHSEASTIVREPLVFQLPYLVSRCFPGLRSLRMINQNIWLSVQEIQSLTTLEHLDWLDLSGNWVSIIAPINLLGLRLRYLGLDNIGLESWPSWLDDLSSSRIHEISLRNNRLRDIPRHVIEAQTSGQPIGLSLQGNPLSRQTLMHIRLSEASGSRFRFGLDIPYHLGTQIARLSEEQTQLRDALEQWAESSSSSRPLSEATIEVRRVIGVTLLAFWRACSEGQTFAVLNLQGIALEDFPRTLPDFFYPYVRNLHLTRVRGDVHQLNQLLRAFRQLTTLEWVGPVVPMPALPSALHELPLLSTLSLRDQGRYIDQATVDFLGQMRQLEVLDLSGNRLGPITDVSSMQGRLRWLSLNNSGLDHWPDWVDGLLPLEGLTLDDNQLTQLPERILLNPRNDQAQTEIALRGNPLTHETMRRAHVSERYQASYTFAMDLPEDILAMSPERRSSESDLDAYASDSDSLEEVGSPGQADAQDAPQVERWLLGSVEQNERHRALWQRLEQRPDAGHLLALTGRLTQAAPYRTAQTRVEFAERVWRVLEAADRSDENRMLSNFIAQEALVQPDTGFQTCYDGAWLVFNQIEIQMFIEMTLNDAPTQGRGAALYRLTQRLYRLHELDAIAREQAQGRDEAEVRLAYRLRWAKELDLPLPPSSMLYQANASIRPGELDSALARVQQGEHGEPFMLYAAQRDFWVQYLREIHAERFNALKQNYLAQVVALPDRYPDRAIDELGEEFAALKRTFEVQEMSLIRDLTFREAFEPD